MVVTYNPHLATMGRTIHKHLYLLNQNIEVKNVFTLSPIVLFKSAWNLRSHLVRSKSYLLVRVVGSIKYQNKRCQVCCNVRETECSQSYHLNTEFKINCKFHCNDKCLVYLLTCKVCWKQHVGETVDRIGITTKKTTEKLRKV